MAFEATKEKVNADIADNGNNAITARVLRECLNDDVIDDLGSAINVKANLEGGNDFTGDQTIDGNVGIGTTLPDRKLEITVLIMMTVMVT